MRTTTLREMLGGLDDRDVIACAIELDATLAEDEIVGILVGLRNVKPTYAYPDLRTVVSVMDGKIAASNLFFGAVSDIAMRKTEIPDDIDFTDCQIVASIVATIANNMSNFEDQNEYFWTDMTNLQKAKIIR